MKTAAVTASAALMGCSAMRANASPIKHPNIVIIYADDLGYGDLSCYGATRVKTPNIDKLAADGVRFTNAHAPSATCTPSRYAMLTGEYAWRREGTGIAAGDAKMIIGTDRITLPSILRDAGYVTAVVGKWHLGLGDGNVDWNKEIKPGPRQIGFDYSFLIPATGDRVPCVFTENGRVINLDPSDPIQVSYGKKIGTDPTGKENPDLLKMKYSHGHDCTIVNGISRIGYMTGGNSARWVDEDIADTITSKAVKFIADNKDRPFFLYFSTHDIHVPRIPNPRFVGKTEMGPRGDAIVQFDRWSAGQVIDALEKYGLTRDTLVILTSDNGPVWDDGYKDDANEKLGDHKAAGPLRGGKYSAFDAGTRVPFIVRWPNGAAQGTTSDALTCQVDLMGSFARLTGQKLSRDAGPDSLDMLDTLIGRSKKGRDSLVEHTQVGPLAIIEGDWKYIEASNRSQVAWQTGIDTGARKKPQLYNLAEDLGEKNNLIDEKPEKAKHLADLLQNLKDKGRTRN